MISTSDGREDALGPLLLGLHSLDDLTSGLSQPQEHRLVHKFLVMSLRIQVTVDSTPPFSRPWASSMAVRCKMTGLVHLVGKRQLSYTSLVRELSLHQAGLGKVRAGSAVSVCGHI